MKIWHVAQWGNYGDWELGKGGNGQDTNCIVVAATLAEAVNVAEHHLSSFRLETFNGGQASVAYLLGDDGRPDGNPSIIFFRWIAHAFNLQHYPAWYYDFKTGQWVDQKTMYGED